VDKRVRTGKKGVGDTLQGGDTRVKSIKVTVMREKVIFSEKKQWHPQLPPRVTPTLVTPMMLLHVEITATHR